MLLLTNASIFNFDTGELIDNAHILINKNLVEKIVEKQSNPALFNDFQKGKYGGIKVNYTMDCTNKIVIPGLTNTHSHTAMTLLRGAAEDVNTVDWFNKHIWIYEKNLIPEYVYYGSLLGAAEMLLSGVTFVCDHYFYMDMAFKAYREAGIRADLAWAVFGQGENWEKDFKLAMDFTESYKNSDETITVSLGPHSPYICPESFLKEIAKLSETMKLKTHIHVSEEKWQVDKSLKETGKTPIKYLHDLGIVKHNSILAHAYHATDEELKLIKKSGALVAHAPKTYMKFGSVMPLLPRALKEKIKISFASDGPTSNNTLSIIEAARDAALLAKTSLSNAEIARIEELIPLLNAGYSLFNKKIGRVEEGFIADLVILNRNHPAMIPEINLKANLLYSLSERAIETVIVNGKIVVQNGEILTVDLYNLRKTVNEISNRMINPNVSPGKGASSKPMQEFGK